MMNKKIISLLVCSLFFFWGINVYADWTGSMEPKNITLRVGETSFVSARQTSDLQVNTWPTYESNDPSVVTVDSKGNIKALKEGTAVITGKFGSLVAGTTTVTVSNFNKTMYLYIGIGALLIIIVGVVVFLTKRKRA